MLQLGFSTTATVYHLATTARPDKRALAERMIEERLGSAMLTVANLCRWTSMSR